MREEIAAVVHPVLAYGIQLRQRLLGNEWPELMQKVPADAPIDLTKAQMILEREQRTLMNLLRPAGEAQRWPDYGGTGDRFLGTRYALACWLDEVFLNEDFKTLTWTTVWGRAWNEKKLETSLYGTNDRAYLFWGQAELAEAVGPDALEVFYLCVMLGFRGEGEKKPPNLDDWREAVEGRLQTSPPEQTGLKVELNARPRRARERLRAVLVGVLVATAALIFFGSWYAFTIWGS
jgi:type VI secretion system protein ImpK